MASTNQAPDIGAVINYFSNLQTEICSALSAEDGKAEFSLEEIPYPNGGLGRPRVLADGAHIEKAAVQFTHSVGTALPPAASERNPELAGAPFQATAISLIVHPTNPHAPTTHMNLRFFLVEADEPSWYFGGGYDLTPYYPVEEDIVHWHKTAADATGDHYQSLKERCDEYFFLPHRDECRGVGGLFYDDLNEWGFDKSFEFMRSVGDSYMKAYGPIVARNKDREYTEEEKTFQEYRRGRYAEFNLVFDRGTIFGLQSGGRTESILMSLPPITRWGYRMEYPEGSREKELVDWYLKPKDWVNL